jgi:SagB-type dehydrogenase family enzyme
MIRRVRRAAAVAATFTGDELWLLAPATGARVPASEAVMSALQRCSSWMRVDELPLSDGGVDFLVRVGLLVEEGTAAARLDVGMRSWASWGDETIAYHLRARRQFIDYPVAQDSRGASTRLKGSPPPPVKRYPGAPETALPVVGEVDGDFGEVLRRRRTVREFADEALPLQEFATLLGLAFGATRVLAPNELGEAFLRTSPSAGARHPVEAYACVANVAGLAPGLYHYAVLDHSLERLQVPASPRLLLSHMCDPWAREAPLVCFLTAVVERCRWRYPFGRMYRTLLLDVGHVAQTFVLVATALGLAAFQTAAFLDPLIEDAVGLDPACEPLLYAVGAGVRAVE